MIFRKNKSLIFNSYSEIEVFILFIDLSVTLHEAVENGHMSTVEYLLSEGASVDEKDRFGMYCIKIEKNFFL